MKYGSRPPFLHDPSRSWWGHFLSWLFIIPARTIMLYFKGSGIDVEIKPSSCQCQQNDSYYNYTCTVSNAATFSWAHGNIILATYSPGNTVGLVRTVGIFRLLLTSRVSVEQYIYNYTSTLQVSADMHDIKMASVNNISCKAVGHEHVQALLKICTIGKSVKCIASLDAYKCSTT